jgi:hypothetical protein
MLNEDEDLPYLNDHDFDTEEYTIGPGRVVVGQFSFDGPVRDTGNVWLHIRVYDGSDDTWSAIRLTPNDRRTLIAILDMADDGGPWSESWDTRYRGSDFRSACSLFIQAIKRSVASSWRSANSTRTESRSWRSFWERLKA